LNTCQPAERVAVSSTSGRCQALADLFEASYHRIVLFGVLILLSHGPYIIDKELITLLLSILGMAGLGANAVHEGMALGDIARTLWSEHRRERS